MSILKILEKYRKNSFSQKDKGERFERLMQAYLLTDPQYANQFKNVWLWNEFPSRNDLGANDTGIDLVALTHNNEYWAIQCKCYKESSIIDKPAVDSFLATSSREFKDEKKQKQRFAQRLWISTTNNWGPNAEEAISNQYPPVTRINLHNLIEAPVDWEKLENGIHGEKARTEKKKIFPHVIEVCDKVVEYFKDNERGRLIMACGTGKTMTSLKIAEKLTQNKGTVLFLVPSIALIGQTLREWTSQADNAINPICICSDPEITKKKTKNIDTDTFSVVDLAWPASTDSNKILEQFEHYKNNGKNGMNVVFSTYQSIDVIAKAQKVLLKNGFPDFDLIICDEAHRTTGYSEPGIDDSAFVRVHDGNFIKSKKRLYMTATPRLYSEEARSQAAKQDIPLWSMDDEKSFGKEIHRIGFGEAVAKGLLTDYKVIILTLNDKDVPPAVQKMIAHSENEIQTDDLTKLIGTVNALSKHFLGNEAIKVEGDEKPMKRAVAFCPRISDSKKIADTYNNASKNYLECLPDDKKNKMLTVDAKHMDGTMAAPTRDLMLSWLKEDSPNNECRIITNVRVLSEGVDVPSLDAVMFLSPKNSQVEVVQSVGRVMRKSTGKKYGYIIIPVIVPVNVEPEHALDDNERYKVVWTVLNALRAHDDRFNDTINKIELNKNRPNQIIVGAADTSFDGDGNAINKNQDYLATNKSIGEQIAIQFEQLQNIVYARIVQKVGDRRYWEQWAKDVAQIAERQIERINYLIDNNKKQKHAFNNFLLGLQENINPSINKEQAIEMLAQHIITKPVFEALFEGYSFVKQNAVSTSMQNMLDALDEKALVDETDTLKKFYESVRKRAEGIDNAEGKQRIIVELYDKFFKTAFPKMVEKLGIVYTPVEVVDFILQSVNDILKKEFGRSISDKNIHILDPFTGTGTFMVRLLQSGLINLNDLERKYKNELHANEIVLLAYYIATINIENAYHDATPDPNDGVGKDKYFPFEGIVLTDTFQLNETKEGEIQYEEMLKKNSDRVEKQKKAPLRIIIGNPPYSRGQEDANDDAQNQNYPILEDKIAKTYAKNSKATLSRDLYNSFVKAFRWSTDRLNKNGGIIGFITGSGWIDKGGYDGFRHCLEKDFSSIYVFNLRGDIRGRSKEGAKKEGQNVFDIMTGVAITILVKNPDIQREKAEIHYFDIGDYLNRKEKLTAIVNNKTISNLNLTRIVPNPENDWINQRNDAFESMFDIEPDKNFNTKSKSIFLVNGVGISSAREPWVYSSSKTKLETRLKEMLSFYNEEVNHYRKTKKLDNNSNKISWSVNLKKDLENGKTIDFIKDDLRLGLLRPFYKSNFYYNKSLIERPGIGNLICPKGSNKNLLITIAGLGNRKGFVVGISEILPDYNNYDGGTKYFPLYYYEENNQQQKSLFDIDESKKYIRRDAISDFILDRAKQQYGKSVSKEDIFYYVYGFLHSPEYRTTFANDLKKMLPRLPLIENVKDFWAFSKAGRELADLHLNYEKVAPLAAVTVDAPAKASDKTYIVAKMRFPKKDQKDTIYYNSHITVSNIPASAYEYIVNGKSAIEWIMERYQVTTHKESGITNDPNDWAKEVGNPRYILDLLLSIINVSVKTVEIVKKLPKIKFG